VLATGTLGSSTGSATRLPPVLVRIGHSADPDDAFMIWALASGRVDRRGFDFELVPEDIQLLNEWALQGTLEVTALSLAAYPFVQDRYALLPHGASIGSGYGPIVVARQRMSLEQLRRANIAVPGRLTTAFLVLGMALGRSFAYRALPFDRITDEVKAGRADAGLLIHEGQLTYAEEGLVKVLDLGEWWLLETGLPLPLGVNVARRDILRLDDLSAVLHDSITAGLEHRDEATAYALGFARDLDRRDADRFIDMYVNELTCDYGDEGRQAVEELLRRAEAAGAYEQPVRVDFL
jgi:1,4-dihydroxy-6-naphthoate synthase